ncbi:hypothetical protein KIN20_004017 [Parelaphostrongylus tenuis]|uniref:Uncharacterized protein n=1 Tax=Parelaphostrongylus tenuis TaxID=148309 RepID=A0AAD5M013_PARTN|nr:hypothetical protein KIN20_004017 [Parelaphostrongylus tenuis]
MNILTNMIRHATGPIIILLVATISTVLGCDVMPPIQGSSRMFTAIGFTLPFAMAYAANPTVSTKLHNIQASEAAGQGFVRRLVMQTLSRSALLPDAVISTILGQHNGTIGYRRLRCNIARRLRLICEVVSPWLEPQRVLLATMAKFHHEALHRHDKTALLKRFLEAFPLRKMLIRLVS